MEKESRMAKRIVWKKAQAQAALKDIAGDVAEFFRVPVPVVFQPTWHTGADWSVRFDTIEVWTKAGRAEMNVDISARFAHMYFKFADPARAKPFNDAMNRLNQFSGKWNAIATPDSWAQDGKPCPLTSIEMFRAELRRDFRKVSEPAPDPAEVALYQAEVAARAARYAAADL
jgi:hypothetical protein